MNITLLNLMKYNKLPAPLDIALLKILDFQQLNRFHNTIYIAIITQSNVAIGDIKLVSPVLNTNK